MFHLLTAYYISKNILDLEKSKDIKEKETKEWYDKEHTRFEAIEEAALNLRKALSSNLR